MKSTNFKKMLSLFILFSVVLMTLTVKGFQTTSQNIEKTNSNSQNKEINLSNTNTTSNSKDKSDSPERVIIEKTFEVVDDDSCNECIEIEAPPGANPQPFLLLALAGVPFVPIFIKNSSPTNTPPNGTTEVISPSAP